MFVQHVVAEDIDARESVSFSKDIVYENPTWEKVEALIKRLDGDRRSYLMMAASREDLSEKILSIGGGNNGIYICFYYDGDEYNIYNQLCDSDQEVDIFMGEMSRRSRKECVNLDSVLLAAKTFFEEGVRDPRLKWHRQQ